MPTVNAEKIARALNLTESRVHQLVREGLPKEGRGQFDPLKCLHFYIRYLQNKIEQKTMPTLDGDEGERAARIRILRAQADEKEMQLAKLRSQLVAVHDVEKAISDLVLTTTAHIMEIPARLAPELVGEESQMMIHAKLDTAIRQVLSRLARSYRNEISVDPNLAKEVVAPNS
jgi:phage terminase Nu1 subunit (DNA packaging protein)